MPAAVVERRVLGHGGKNWITKTPVPGATLGAEGALPKFISFVAGALVRSGHPTGEAIGLAVGACRRWARGEGKVSALTRKRAAEAIAEWDAKKALAHATPSKRNLSNGARVSIDLAGPKGYIHGWIKVGGGKEDVRQHLNEHHGYKVSPAGNYGPYGRVTAAQMHGLHRKEHEDAGATHEHATANAAELRQKTREMEAKRQALRTASLRAGNAAVQERLRRMGGKQLSGGSVTQLNFADTEPDADDMMAHVRASVPKGHGMKVPDGTEPAKVAKMHGYLHRQGNAKHSHSNGAMNYSTEAQVRHGVEYMMRRYGDTQLSALDFAAQSNAGTVKGVAGTSPGARKKASAKGQAMPDGSFPVSNRNLYDRARKALGRTNPAKRAKVKAFLTRVAKKKGWPPPGGDTNMSIPDDALVRALYFANLPNVLGVKVNANPKPSQGLGKAMATYRQPVTTTAKAGNEMFPPKARKTTGPASGRNIPYGTPKGAKPAPGGPQAPLKLPKGGYEGMQIYTPANPAEHSHVMKALRGARALRRQGRTAQANSVMAGLVRQVTGRARKMPNGQMRAHTIREVTTGLAQMAKGTHGITRSGSTGVKKGHDA